MSEIGLERPSLDELYTKARGICFVCNKKVARAVASREHILPVSLGGTYEESNMTISHKKCNNKRGNGYRGIYSHFRRMDSKHFVLLEVYGLLLQIVPQPDGAYIILSKRKEDFVDN